MGDVVLKRTNLQTGTWPLPPSDRRPPCHGGLQPLQVVCLVDVDLCLVLRGWGELGSDGPVFGLLVPQLGGGVLQHLPTPVTEEEGEELPSP